MNLEILILILFGIFFAVTYYSYYKQRKIFHALSDVAGKTNESQKKQSEQQEILLELQQKTNELLLKILNKLEEK